MLQIIPENVGIAKPRKHTVLEMNLRQLNVLERLVIRISALILLRKLLYFVFLTYLLIISTKFRCGKIATDPPCHIVDGDLTLPYPECCPQVKCDE